MADDSLCLQTIRFKPMRALRLRKF